jgi:hypothetical protein
MIRGYDEWKLRNGLEDERIITHCEHCGGEIYNGEEFIFIPNGHESVHEDCFGEYAFTALNANRTYKGA